MSLVFYNSGIHGNVISKLLVRFTLSAVRGLTFFPLAQDGVDHRVVPSGYAVLPWGGAVLESVTRVITFIEGKLSNVMTVNS